MSKTMKLYPSGFLGSAAVATTEPISNREIGRRIFEAITVRDMDQYTANRDVAKLWDDYRSSGVDPNSFEFLSDLLSVAKKAFGQPDFHSWIKAQQASPFIIQDHADWIDDTLDFLYGDKPRKYQYNVWAHRLILGEQVRIDLRTPAVRKYLMNGNRDVSINALLTQWIKRGGVGDLMSSLYVLFGPR